MTVNKLELRCIDTGAGAAGDTGAMNIWRLVTNDNAAAVEANAYFDGVHDNGMQAGDIIFATLDKDGTPLVKIYHVTAGGADVAIRGIGAAISALTYNLVVGTANGALQACVDLTDAPATADALRDDIVTNLLPAIRNNFADLAAKLEEVRAAVTV